MARKPYARTAARIHLRGDQLHDGRISLLLAHAVHEHRSESLAVPLTSGCLQPSRCPAASRDCTGGRLVVFVDTFLAKVPAFKLDKNDAIDEAFSRWLESKT